MSAKILVIEYEPRYLEHVRSALTGDLRLEVAGSVDDAVDLCASFEPTVVVITSVLPKLKVEDAITQLRARAGLRATPFLILMSGYQGGDSRKDAARYGAQDILQRPFDRDELRARVAALAAAAPDPAATQAIPQEMMEALRRSAGLAEGGAGSVTSNDLFGDILSDVEGGEQQSGAPPSDRPPQRSDEVDRALAEILATSRKPERRSRSQADVDADVEKRLSETLSGLRLASEKKPSSTAAGDRSSPSAAGSLQPPESRAAEAPVEERRPPAPVPPPRAPVKPPSEKAAPPPRAQPSPSAKDRPPPPAPHSATAQRPPSPVRRPTQRAPESADSPRPGNRDRFGQYLLEERIATGGMAEVFKARMVGMEGFQKTVAIKRILSNLTDSDEFVRMFIDEAKLAAQLSHTNIIQIFDLGRVGRSHYIAMEFIEGRDLRTILSECRRGGRSMPIGLALHIAALLASALDYAHTKRDFENRDLGLVHRDVSPQNVLISYDGDVKLCDFGIAKAASKASQTRAGALKGKLQYMSPEQAWGKTIDHRSDIFSLGLVLYEMLTDEKVFAGDSELSVLEQVREPVIREPSARNPEVSAEIDEIVMRALEPDRDRRYQAAVDLQRDLEQAMRSAGLTADRSAIAGFLTSLSGRTPDAPKAAAVEGGAEPPEQPPASAAGPLEEPPDEGPDPASAKSPTDAPPLASERVTDSELEDALGGGAPPALPPLLDEAERETARRGGAPPWLWWIVAAVVVIAAAAGGWYLLAGRSGGAGPRSPSAPVAVLATTTPTPEADAGLLTEEELIEQARAVAAAEIVKQEAALRERLEREFPTATPIPPTPTATITPSPVPTATPTPPPPTPTSPPPTATPVPPTPTPSVREGDIVAMGAGVTPPVPIYQEAPQYPPVARRMERSGVVEAEVLVGIDGRVEEFRVTAVDRRGLGFEDATEEAVRAWRYRPATKHGVPVRMWVKVRVPFELRGR